MYIIVVVFFGLVNVSMAEMASMAPTAGMTSQALASHLCLRIKVANITGYPSLLQEDIRSNYHILSDGFVC